MIPNLYQLLNTDTLGRTVAFPLQVDPRTGRLKPAEGEAAVTQAILILVGTLLGERVMREDEGVLLSKLLFSDIDSAQAIVPAQLADAVSAQEPRVTAVRATAGVREGEPGVLYVELSWTFRLTNRQGSLIYPFYLDPSVKK
jgi:hypothetical protein